MKGIVVTTDNVVEVRDFSQPLLVSCSWTVGDAAERVAPCGLSSPYCMLVNGHGQSLNLPINYVGSILYGTAIHGLPIFGDLVVMKNIDSVGLEGRDMDNILPLDFTGLDDHDIDNILPRIKNIANALKNAVATA